MKRLIKKSKLINCNKAINFIKMIKKAADENPQKTMEAIKSLTIDNENGLMNELYSDIIANNPDCIYNGKVYRKLEIDKDDIMSMIDPIDEDEDNEYEIDDVLEALNSVIITNTLQSTSSDLDACEEFDPEIGGDNLSVIISFNCANGLDVMKLTKKYLNIAKDNKDTDGKYRQYVKYLNNIINAFEEEKEIFCVVPDEYEIYSIDDDIVNLMSTIIIE